jgi:hypothetical protein
MKPNEQHVESVAPQGDLPIAPVEVFAAGRPTPVPGGSPSPETLEGIKAVWGPPSQASFDNLDKLVEFKRQQGWPEPSIRDHGQAQWGATDQGYICACAGGGGHLTVWRGIGGSADGYPCIGSIGEIAALLDRLREHHGLSWLIPIAPQPNPFQYP